MKERRERKVDLIFPSIPASPSSLKSKISTTAGRVMTLEGTEDSSSNLGYGPPESFSNLTQFWLQ